MIVLREDSNTAVNQTDRVIEMTGWPDIETVPPPSAGSRRRSSRIRQIARTIESSRPVAFGDYTNRLMRHLANQADHAILLDDGVGSRRVPPTRSEGGVRRFEHTGRNPRLKDLGSRLLGIDASTPRALTYFSFYDLEPGPGDSAIRHEFAATRARFPSPEQGGGVVFIGNCLAEFGLYDRDLYIASLASIIEHVGVPVRYLPHRREDSTKLETLVRAGAITLEEPDLPLEIGLLTADQLPCQIIGFYSTAFHTLAALLPPEIQLAVYEMDSAGYRRQCEASATEVYATMADVTNDRVEVRTLPRTPEPDFRPVAHE